MPSHSADDYPRVFLSYAREDYNAVSAIYDRLTDLGLKPWMDRRDLLPGQRWREMIPREVQRSDFVFVCLSPRSVDKRGVFQQEIRTALDAWQDRLQDDIYLIPVRLEACDVSGELGEFQWVDLYKEDGWDILLRAIRVDAERHGRPVPYALGRELVHPLGLGDRPIHLDAEATQWVGIRHRKLPPEEPYSQLTSAVFSRQPMTGGPKPLTITTPIRLELVRIPAGTFLIGDGKKAAHADEFYIGKYPITNRQYAPFVRAGGSAPGCWVRGRIPSGKQEHPVVPGSWEDAVAYCDWLNKETGWKFRLPTEEEWEKAARGTDDREYPWGHELPTEELCNWNQNVGDTSPVGRYSPSGDSPYGCADMSGNVWEWTDHRVLRGGSFTSDVYLVRCAARIWDYPSSWHGRIGFRVCAA